MAQKTLSDYSSAQFECPTKRSGVGCIENLIPAIYPVACHTDNVGPGSTFVVIQGMKLDGATFIPVALQKGARTIVIEHDVVLSAEIMHEVQKHAASIVRVENTRAALAQLSAQATGYPAKKLKIIAITGTKGKTTTTFLLEYLLRCAGHKVAMLSTVLNRINGVDFSTKLTTQQPDYLHVFFNACIANGIEYVVMEVAAQAFSLHRVAGLEFDAAIFTNFSQEHAEFYPNLEEYFAAKCEIINHLKPSAPLFINQDDALVAQLKTRYQNAHFFSRSTFTCPALMGDFNTYNIAAATQCAAHIGITPLVIQQTLDSFKGVPGRLEKYPLPNGAIGIIDYAHNPSSFQAVLATLRPLTKKLIVVFGCGGNRDATKRPIMGNIASSIADVVVLTADNPRTESVETITQDILSGVHRSDKVVVEFDRARAIHKAYELSSDGALVVLLGKGPDEYQIIDGVTYPFSEKRLLQSLN